MKVYGVRSPFVVVDLTWDGPQSEGLLSEEEAADEPFYVDFAAEVDHGDIAVDRQPLALDRLEYHAIARFQSSDELLVLVD